MDESKMGINLLLIISKASSTILAVMEPLLPDSFSRTTLLILIAKRLINDDLKKFVVTKRETL